MKEKPDRSHRRCIRRLSAKESLVSAAGFDENELTCLTVLRRFCQSLTPEGKGGWIQGFISAEHVWGAQRGPLIAHRLMRVLQAVRTSRYSCFSFSTPDCAICAQVLTEHERRLISAIAFVASQRPEQARLQMMLLCEGNVTDEVMMHLEQLVELLPPSESKERGLGRKVQEVFRV